MVLSFNRFFLGCLEIDILMLWRSFWLLWSYLFLFNQKIDIFTLRRRFWLTLPFNRFILNCLKVDIFTLLRGFWLGLFFNRLFLECWKIDILILGRSFRLLLSFVFIIGCKIRTSLCIQLLLNFECFFWIFL